MRKVLFFMLTSLDGFFEGPSRDIFWHTVADEISKLKEQSGKDIAIFGSSDLTVSLAKQGLVDEYRIMLNPIVLGSGKRLLEGLDQKLDLKLVKTRTFKNGNVLLYYQP